MELFNYKDNCRLCLKRHTDFMKNIFTYCIEGYQDSLVQNIFALFKLELNTHKDYPQFICRKCLTELENILLFKEDLQHNQDFLFGLFRAAYPNYSEKNLHTINYSNSKECDSRLKTVAVNTVAIDLENLDDSEYIRVPVDFLKPFSPQVSLQRAEVSCLNNKPSEIKEEITQDNSFSNDLKLSVYICKYCSKVFRSQSLVNTHYKEVHKLEEQQKKNETKKRIPNSTQEPLAKKVKTNKDKSVSFENLIQLSNEQITLPQMDLQNNNNADVKEELRDSPSNQQVDKILLTEPVFLEKQALFLQNFDLIAKQEAALLKAKQKSVKSLPKSLWLEKQVKKKKKTVVKPLKSKNKLLIKPLSDRRRGQPRKIEQNILCRSVQFLKRYGWRNLKSSSRQGTFIKTDRNSLFERTDGAKISKKSNPKRSLACSVVKEKSQLEHKGPKSNIAVNEAGTRCLNNSHTQETSLSDKIKRSNSINSSSDNRSLDELTTCTTIQNSATFISELKDSPTSSITSNKKNLKFFNKNVGIENIKLELAVKNEPLTAFLKKEDDEFKELTSISSRSIDNVNGAIKRATSKMAILDNQNADHRLLEPSLKGVESCKLVNNASHASFGLHDPQIELKGISPKLKRLKSKSIDPFLPTENLEVKKELRIRLERDGSPVKHNGFKGSSVDFRFEKHNFKPFRKNISHLKADKLPDKNKVSKGRGQLKKIVDIASPKYTKLASASHSTRSNNSNNLLSRRTRGRPFKNPDLKNMLISSSCNILKKEKENPGLNAKINKSTIFKYNDGLNKNKVANEGLGAVTRKQGRSKKKPVLKVFSSPSTNANIALGFTQNRRVLNSKVPLLDVTQSELGYSPCKSNALLLDVTQKELEYSPYDGKNENLSTLQDLTDRYEKGDNIGLRIKLRKTASCESLNSLKYDTQELDENFKIKAEAIDESTNIEFNDVPDNEILFMSHDRGISNYLVGNNALKDEKVTPEKVVNVDLEDKEVQMVFLINDDEKEVDFDNDDISDYIKFKKNSLTLEPSNMVDRPKRCLPLKESSSCTAVNEKRDSIVKQKQINLYQTCLPRNKPKAKKTDSHLSKKDFTNSLTSDGPRSTVTSETTPIKRRGRPPNKFSPTLYSTKRSKSTAKLLKRSLSKKSVSLAQENNKPRSRSTSQQKVIPCVKNLFNKVGKRGRTPKKDQCKIVYPVIEKASSLNKLHKHSQQKQVCTSNQLLMASAVNSRNSLGSFPRNFSE